jgi:hypothetical protein
MSNAEQGMMNVEGSKSREKSGTPLECHSGEGRNPVIPECAECLIHHPGLDPGPT